MSEVCMIAALTRNRVIGRNNTLPWALREDLRNFKAVTAGYPVLMGRKTWESLAGPLPGRVNIVITTQRDYKAIGAIVVHSMTEAMNMSFDVKRIFIIGGGQLYNEAIPYTDRFILTLVDTKIKGDVYFPDISRLQLNEVSRKHVDADVFNEFDYDIVEYVRQ